LSGGLGVLTAGSARLSKKAWLAKAAAMYRKSLELREKLRFSNDLGQSLTELGRLQVRWMEGKEREILHNRWTAAG
jgi:hypothetical protein